MDYESVPTVRPIIEATDLQSVASSMGQTVCHQDILHFFFGKNLETFKSSIKSWLPIVVKSPAVYSRLQLKWELKQFRFILMPMLKPFMLIWPMKKLTLVQPHLPNHILLWIILLMLSVSDLKYPQKLQYPQSLLL